LLVVANASTTACDIPAKFLSDLLHANRSLSEKAGEASEEDELHRESPIAAAERVRQFTTVKELLTATELGTS
jgi:hypothetical protein